LRQRRKSQEKSAVSVETKKRDVEHGPDLTRSPKSRLRLKNCPADELTSSEHGRDLRLLLAIEEAVESKREERSRKGAGKRGGSS